MALTISNLETHGYEDLFHLRTTSISSGRGRLLAPDSTFASSLDSKLLVTVPWQSDARHRGMRNLKSSQENSLERNMRIRSLGAGSLQIKGQPRHSSHCLQTKSDQCISSAALRAGCGEAPRDRWARWWHAGSAQGPKRCRQKQCVRGCHLDQEKHTWRKFHQDFDSAPIEGNLTFQRRRSWNRL